jgi:hypothetical protein
MNRISNQIILSPGLDFVKFSLLRLNSPDDPGCFAIRSVTIDPAANQLCYSWSLWAKSHAHAQAILPGRRRSPTPNGMADDVSD